MKSTLLDFSHSKVLLFGILSVSIVAITIDLEISNIADFTEYFLTSNSGFLTFISILVVFWTSQLIFYYSIRTRLKVMKYRTKKLLFIEKLLTTSLWLLLILNFFIAIEMLSFGHYSIYLLFLIVIISYSINTFFMGLLSYLLFSWNKTANNNALLSYSLAAISASISAILTVIYMTSILLTKPEEISPNLDVLFPIYQLNSVLGILNVANTLFFLISFILMWLGSTIVLRHYSSNIPKTRYSLLIGAPLVYFVGQYFPILNTIFPFIDSSSTSFIYYYTLFFTLSSVIGSVIFAISFWLMAKDLARNANISTYLMICGYGFIMFFSSATATVIHTPYPPFGIVSISLVGLSSYCILYGIYSSSVSLSEDIKLRLLIRRSANSHLRFLSSMSAGYLQDKIINQVFDTTQKFDQSNIEQTGISTSLSSEEIKMYIRQVVDELKNKNEFGQE